MNLFSLKRGVVICIASFCLMLFISVLVYVFRGSVPEIFHRLIALSIGMGILTFIHFWSGDNHKVEPFRGVLFTLLKIEFIISSLSLFPLILGWFDWIIVTIVFSSAQLAHLVIYLSNMFLFDDSISKTTNKNTGEILVSAKGQKIFPNQQGSDASDE